MLPAYRRRGLGRKLATKTIEDARAAKIERIELEVFASNMAAIALYRTLGFIVEGTKRQARKLDGVCEDILMMAALGDL